MRRSKSKKTVKKHAVYLLFTLSVFFAYDAFSGNVLFEKALEANFNSLFFNKLRFDIGKVEGGVFGDIAAKNISIYSPGLKEPVRLEGIEFPYRIWHFIFTKFVNRTGEKREIFKIVFEKTKGEIFVKGFILDEKNLALDIGLKHIDFKGMDIVGEIKAFFGLAGNVSEFQISFKNLIVNYNPFKNIDIKGEIIRNKRIVDIHSVILSGDDGRPIIAGKGKVNFSEKVFIDIFLSINNLMLNEFVLTKYKEEIAKGLMNGEARINGPIDNLKTKAHFDIQDGKIQKLEFNSLFGTLKGKGHMAKVEDGRIIKDGGDFILSGEMDFSMFPTSNVFDGLKIETDNNVCVWSGWEISKRFETSQVTAQKKIAKDITFSFDAYINEDMLKPKWAQDKKNEVGVEYKIDKNESIMMKLKDDEGFLGLEHKVKF